MKKQIGGTKNREELRIPVLVTACVEEIERRGLQEEGIYRISGAVTTVSRLQDLFDRGKLWLPMAKLTCFYYRFPVDSELNHPHALMNHATPGDFRLNCMQHKMIRFSR